MPAQTTCCCRNSATYYAERLARLALGAGARRVFSAIAGRRTCPAMAALNKSTLLELYRAFREGLSDFTNI